MSQVRGVCVAGPRNVGRPGTVFCVRGRFASQVTGNSADRGRRYRCTYPVCAAPRAYPSLTTGFGFASLATSLPACGGRCKAYQKRRVQAGFDASFLLIFAVSEGLAPLRGPFPSVTESNANLGAWLRHSFCAPSHPYESKLWYRCKK